MTFFENPDILIANAMMFAKTVESENKITYKFLDEYTKKVHEYLKSRDISMIVTYGEESEPSNDFEREEKYIKCYQSTDYLFRKYGATLSYEMLEAVTYADEYFIDLNTKLLMTMGIR